jgi:hypothetical protein
MRTALGFVAAFVAVVVVEILAACGYVALLILPPGRGIGEPAAKVLGSTALLAAFNAAPIALATVALLALLYLIVSRRLTIFLLRYWVLFGAVIGAGVFGIFAYPDLSLRMQVVDWASLIANVIAGVAGSVAFWLVVRPQKTAQSPSYGRVSPR